MKKFSAAAILISCIMLTSNVNASLCSIDEVPAATLLFPYFHIDLNECVTTMAQKTVLLITNTSATPRIVHVTTWTDWGAPVLCFDIYLAGQDTQGISLGQMFCGGYLPVTGPSVSNHGAHSDPPVYYPVCDTWFPYPSPIITGNSMDRLRAMHTGQIWDEQCYGSDRSNQVVVGYVTADVANSCSTDFPSDPGYFGSGGVAAADNVLVGEWFIGDTANITGALFPAIHIEADPTGTLFKPGDHTFYGRYVNGDASDAREPLVTSFSANYANDPTDTEYLIWRETDPTTSGYTCGTNPSWYPLPTSVLFYDEISNYDPAGTLSAPLATQRVTASSLSEIWGVAFLDLKHNKLQSIYGDDLAQAWVSTMKKINNNPIGSHARQMDRICPGLPPYEPSRKSSNYPLKVVNKGGNAVEVEEIYGATAYNAYMDPIGEWYSPDNPAITECTLTTWSDLGHTILLDVTVPDNHWISVSAANGQGESDVGQDSDDNSRFDTGIWLDCALP